VPLGQAPILGQFAPMLGRPLHDQAHGARTEPAGHHGQVGDADLDLLSFVGRVEVRLGMVVNVLT
jgi:hypothetical protein